MIKVYNPARREEQLIFGPYDNEWEQEFCERDSFEKRSFKPEGSSPEDI